MRRIVAHLTVTARRRCARLRRRARRLRCARFPGGNAMSEHRISLRWARNGGPFARGNYLAKHEVRFSGAQAIQAGPAAEYGGGATDVNPEQMLLSALSSCHMLTFLAVAA